LSVSLIVCWMRKSVCEYLVPFSNESVKTSAGCSKKNYLSDF
jgi:hypothetical protein